MYLLHGSGKGTDKKIHSVLLCTKSLAADSPRGFLLKSQPSPQPYALLLPPGAALWARKLSPAGWSCRQRIREPENPATQSWGEGTQPEKRERQAGQSGAQLEGRWLIYPVAHLLKKIVLAKKQGNETRTTYPELAQHLQSSSLWDQDVGGD